MIEMERARGNENIRRMVWGALLSGLATVLMYVDTVVPVFPSFLKMDLSDVPALIGAFAWGPGNGVAIEAVKNLLHCAASSSAGVGEMANFVMGSALVLPAGLIYRANKTKTGALIGMAAGVATMTATAAILNGTVLIPLYSNFVPIDTLISMAGAAIPAIEDVPSLVIYGIVPFNLLKGTIVSISTFWLYKRISPLLGN